MKVLISHGSGGIGPAELNMQKVLESAGYEVLLLDNFAKHNIKMLRWNAEIEPDNYDCMFDEMFNYDFSEDEDLIHIGFSLGGFFGLKHSDKFIKNYLFYPGIFGFTKEMLERNYHNTMVFMASEDGGAYKYYNFEKQAKSPPNKYLLVGAHHGFMIEGSDREIDMVSYGGNWGNLMDDSEFLELKPNHAYLSNRYGHTSRSAVIKHHPEFSHMYSVIVKEDIDETVSRL